MSSHILSPKRTLEVVEFPGKVENVEQMIAKLGGIIKISQAFTGEQKRLELRYHSENPYNKGIFAEASQRSGLLLSVKVRRYKNDSRPPEYEVRLIGHSTQIFAFQNLCDFQYLPIYRDTTANQCKLALNLLKPESPLDIEYFNRENVPFLCPPTAFARLDTVCHSGLFRYEETDDGQQETLGTTPKVVVEAPDFVTFNMVDPLPSQPDGQTIKRMKIKYISDEQFERVKKLFEECPVWTRIALLYESRVSNDKLKCILPSLAFYYNTGPWRMLHVRYGYDPRKTFESRHYQTFDFRLRLRTGVSEFIAVRKELLRKQHVNGEENKTGPLVQDLNYPYFDEHRLPRARQCILRYCDLHVPKIQEMLEKIPSPLTGAICNEKTGWLPVGFDAQVRQIVSTAVRELLRAHSRKRSEQTGDAELEDDENEDEEDDEEMDSQYEMDAYEGNEGEEFVEDMQID